MLRQMGSHTYRSCSRATTAVRGGECLVEVEMEDVKAHVSRTYDSHQRVHVGTIVIQQTATFMHKRRNLPDILLEKTEGIRIGHHDAGNGIVKKRLEVLDIDKSVCLRLYLHYLKSADSSGSWIGAMRTVRNDYACTFKVATGHMVLTDHHQSGKFSMCSCKRIESELGHSGYLRESM